MMTPSTKHIKPKFSIELIKPISPVYFDDKRRSISILAASSILKILLPDHQINKMRREKLPGALQVAGRVLGPRHTGLMLQHTIACTNSHATVCLCSTCCVLSTVHCVLYRVYCTLYKVHCTIPDYTTLYPFIQVRIRQSRI